MGERELIATDIDAYLARLGQKEILRFLTAGSVDDGKSTLIGRLLHDANMVYEDQLDALRRDSAKKSAAGGEIDYSLLVDGLLSEREQGITIDVAYRYFATERRKFIIADTPGHEQYTRNMATGASTADLAVILVDARYGVLPQTRRHSFIASLLGIQRVVVAVNKMDLMGYDEAVFETIRGLYEDFARKLDFTGIHYLPLSALKGDNVVTKSEAMPWYAGPPLLEHLETVPLTDDRRQGALRFPVQLVQRPDLDFRGFSGTIASGTVRRGDTVVALPSRKTSTVARIVTFDGDLDEASAPRSVTLTLSSEIDVSRGDTLVHGDALPHVARSVEAMVVWMHERPMTLRTAYLLKQGTRTVSAEVHDIHERVDVNTLESAPANRLGLNDIGRVTLGASRPLHFDAYRKDRATGAFILIDRLTNATVGAGMILGPGAEELHAAEAGHGEGRVTLAERRARLGQEPCALFLTGGEAARREELATSLERRLWDEGYTACVLDPRAVSALKVCLGLGLISLVLTDGDVELSGARASLGDVQIVEVRCGDGEQGGSVEAVLHTLRTRDVIR
ncbi:sulfate adenylyltransferase subunit CysN [Chondromyces apiculatus]|uniref:Sulfate adenylyltransferase subunit 1 n=1 Tax=Chondromyces apiculatus DSM 436 TaxID=1192034 RepID=A0A017SUZ7_9BACT|nr:sulfate adenylyltransferase subunit CysN [Chondromyces apiculatus]EYF00101.1 Sulfate adenylyltransferase subunit 1 [Chondromyces apiculatus DSM 436]